MFPLCMEKSFCGKDTQSKREVDILHDQHVKYGGIKFVNNVPPDKINQFVEELPDEQRKSLFNVVKLLDEEGLITLEDGDNVTIDESLQEFMIPNGGDGQ